MALIAKLISISYEQCPVVDNAVKIYINKNAGTVCNWTLYVDGISVQELTTAKSSTNYTFTTTGIHEIYMQDTYYDVKSNVIQVLVINNTLSDKLKCLIRMTFSNKQDDNKRICQIVNEEYDYSNGKLEVG